MSIKVANVVGLFSRNVPSQCFLDRLVGRSVTFTAHDLIATHDGIIRRWCGFGVGGRGMCGAHVVIDVVVADDEFSLVFVLLLLLLLLLNNFNFMGLGRSWKMLLFVDSLGWLCRNEINAMMTNREKKARVELKVGVGTKVVAWEVWVPILELGISFIDVNAVTSHAFTGNLK
jgi:hypothetical protein